jgi:hypothetical protein
MFGPFDHPFLILVFTFGASWRAALIGSYIHIRQKDVDGNNICPNQLEVIILPGR